ncbi:hypothetical protein [Sorangium sp. So ce1182]|uniref:hypothetical protein n=1 Tax=Sorangium sp. So ce1182 TaxID=3133334 RepID=UPI003F636048
MAPAATTPDAASTGAAATPPSVMTPGLLLTAPADETSDHHDAKRAPGFGA